MLLRNVSIIGKEGLKDISIEDGIIDSVNRIENSISKNEKVSNIFFNNVIAFPGLINSHDHLDFNLFPALKNRTYKNYKEWGKDIQDNNKKEIDKVLQIPQPLRTQFGIYKNLLNGFTTVVNHGKHLKIEDELINVFQNTHSIHSVGFEKNWKWKLNNPFKNKWLVSMHVGEGKDEASHQEISQLIKWDFLKRKIIGIHGVAMDENQAEQFHALVWCPASNYFLLNKTAAIDFLKDRTTILFGSDSTLTSSWNIWEHIRLARNEKMLTDKELFDSLTSKPAEIWGLHNYGKIENGNYADIIIAKKRNQQNDYDAFFSLNPEDILLVMHKGNIKLFDAELETQLNESDIEITEFCRISINGQIKYVKGKLPQLIKEIKKYYHESNFPFEVLH